MRRLLFTVVLVLTSLNCIAKVDKRVVNTKNDTHLLYFNNQTNRYESIDLGHHIQANEDASLQIISQNSSTHPLVKSFEHKLANLDRQPIGKKMPPPAEPPDLTPN